MKPNSFHEFVLNDLLGPIGGITSRAMFGGYSFYKDGVIFAIIAEGQLYFKVDDSNRAQYEAAGSGPFVYSSRDGRDMTMAYWQLPDEIIDNPEELQVWVQQSVEVSKNTKSKKKK